MNGNEIEKALDTEMCMGCVGQGSFGYVNKTSGVAEIRECPRCHGTRVVRKGTLNPIEFTSEENKAAGIEE